MEGQRGRTGSGIHRSLAGALATAQLRRLQAGWAVSAVGGWVFFVALSVYAFDAGGATAVGAAALTRMVPAGLAAPVALVVLVAIEMLALGGSGVGWLNACWGLGGVIGGAAALALLRRGRLTAGLSTGGLLVGIPLMLIGAAETLGVAVVMLVLLGIGYALIEVAGLSLLQRLPANDVLGRAFAVVESSYWITIGLGAIVAPLIVHLVGLRDALLLVGACLPLLVALRWRPLALLSSHPSAGNAARSLASTRLASVPVV